MLSDSGTGDLVRQPSGIVNGPIPADWIVTLAELVPLSDSTPVVVFSDTFPDSGPVRVRATVVRSGMPRIFIVWVIGGIVAVPENWPEVMSANAVIDAVDGTARDRPSFFSVI